MRVTIDDVRACGNCVVGTREFCESLGLDFKKLVNEGLCVEELRLLNNEIVNDVIKQAEQRNG